LIDDIAALLVISLSSIGALRVLRIISDHADKTLPEMTKNV
jgi:hypothetical protein